jgi:hypothetical protein
LKIHPTTARQTPRNSSVMVEADGDVHVGDAVEAPAEAADQIDRRVEQRDGLPDRRQHVDGIEGAAEEGERRDHQQGHQLQLLEIVGPDPDDEAEQAEGHRREHQENHHPDGVGDLDRHEQVRRGQDDQGENRRFGRRRADIAYDDLHRRNGRRHQLVDRAGEFRKEDAEGGIGDGVGQKRQHDQARHDEGAVAHPADLLDARADRGAEDDEVQRCRDHRGHDALQQRAPGAGHLEQVDGADGVEVHVRFLTRLTKMSSSELSRVSRSLNRMPASLRSLSSRGDAGALALGVIGIDQFAAVGGQLQLVGRERGRDFRQRLLQMQDQLLLAQHAHQLGLVLDQNDLAVVDHADPVGHLLGFLDVVRGQDHGDAACAQDSHQLPHLAPQLDVDAGGGFVEKQDLRLVRQGLGDQHPALHAARQGDDLVVPLVPQSEILQQLFDVGRPGRLAEQSAAEADGGPHRLEGFGREFLGHQTDPSPGLAVLRHDVEAVGGNGAGRRPHQTADDADQRGLAGPVRPQQRKDLAVANLQTDVLESPEAGGVGLGKVCNGNDRRHEGDRLSRAFAGNGLAGRPRELKRSTAI